MSDIERLRKLAGIKPKKFLTESTLDLASIVKQIVSAARKGQPLELPLPKEQHGNIHNLIEKCRGVYPDYSGRYEVYFKGIEYGITFGDNSIKSLPMSEMYNEHSQTNESTTEYDLSISTDTFGQYKSKPLEPDFPADMGEKFSKFSSGESNDAIGDGEDGFGKEEGAEQPEDSGTAEKSETKSAPEPKAESKPKDTTEAPKEPAKNFFDDESDDEPKDEKEPEEPKEDDEFSKKVKEAQEYYRIKHFVRSNIKESNDYADAFMAAIKVLAEQAETLIVKYGANLSQMQEKQIAMDVATDLSEGRKTVYEAAKIHGARGSRKGSTYTFEFTDTASALMFTNYLAETCECVSVLSQNRGFIEAKVRDFVEVKKKLDEGWRNVGANPNGTSGSNDIEHIHLSGDQLKKHKISPPKGGEKYGKCYVFSDGRRRFHVYAGQPEGNAYRVSVRSATNASDFRAMGEIIDYLKS